MFDSIYYIRFKNIKRYKAWISTNDPVRHKIDDLAKLHATSIRKAQKLIRDLEGGYLPIQ